MPSTACTRSGTLYGCLKAAIKAAATKSLLPKEVVNLHYAVPYIFERVHASQHPTAGSMTR